MSGFIKIDKSLTGDSSNKVTSFGYLRTTQGLSKGFIAIMLSMQGAFINFSFKLINGELEYDNRSGVGLNVDNGDLILSNTSKFSINNLGDLIRQ